MARTILCNVFTTNMLSWNDGERTFRFAPLSLADAREILVTNGFEQAVGHPATCTVLSARLGLDIQPERANVRLTGGELLIVANVVIPRLNEGQVLTQAQVEECPIVFWMIEEK